MSLFYVFATLIILLNFHMTFTSAKPDSDWLPMSFQHPFLSQAGLKMTKVTKTIMNEYTDV